MSEEKLLMAIHLHNTESAEEDVASYRQMSEINITPFVDVMARAPGNLHGRSTAVIAGVPVDLPQTSATRISQPRKPMVVTLTSDQKLYIRDELVPRDRLVPQLAALRAQEGDNVVYVRADRKKAPMAIS